MSKITGTVQVEFKMFVNHKKLGDRNDLMDAISDAIYKIVEDDLSILGRQKREAIKGVTISSIKLGGVGLSDDFDLREWNNSEDTLDDINDEIY